MAEKTWAYIATTAGAPLYTTLELAEGTPIKRINISSKRAANDADLGENIGLIHRSHFSEGKENKQVKKLKVGHKLVLMYDFMDTGLIYPLARFKIVNPNDYNLSKYLKRNLHPKPYLGGAPLVEINGNELEPDYAGNIDTGPNNDKSNGRHLALAVRQMSAGPPKNTIGKIFCRDPEGEKNTIVPWGNIKKKMINEYDSEFRDSEKRKEMLEKLIPPISKNIVKSLIEPLGSRWKALDGRAKQLLVRAEQLQSATKKKDDYFTSSTLPGYCLVAFVEYEMLRILKKAADRKLIGMNLKEFKINDLVISYWEGRKHKIRLPLAPEGLVDRCSFFDQSNAISEIAKNPPGGKQIIAGYSEYNKTDWLENWETTSRAIKRARNRIAHSYFLQKGHLDELYKLVYGEKGVIKLLHG